MFLDSLFLQKQINAVILTENSVDFHIGVF